VLKEIRKRRNSWQEIEEDCERKEETFGPLTHIRQ
jgi:hypothetical protein